MFSSADIPSPFAEYRTKGVIVDTNILLLYLVGSYDERLVGRFKKTQAYDVDDYVVVRNMLAFFEKVIVLPNILTEVCNHLNQLDEKRRTRLLASLPVHFSLWEEEHIPSIVASRWKYFSAFGLTDSAIALLASREHLVVTDDGRFSALLQSLHIDVVNINHIRQWSKP